MFLQSPADAIPLAADAVDVVFTSNFLEHLHNKAECDRVLAEVMRVAAGRALHHHGAKYPLPR